MRRQPGFCASAGDVLAELVGAVRSQLWLSGERVTASYIGGVFRSSVVLTRFSEALRLSLGCRCAAADLGRGSRRPDRGLSFSGNPRELAGSVIFRS